MAAPAITRPNRMLDVGLAVAVVAVGVGGYLTVGPKKASVATVTRTATVARGVVVSSVQASGNVQPGQTYSVGFQTGGQVIGISAKVGDHVVKGQELAQLDPSTAAAGLASAQAGSRSAQSHLAQVEQVLTPAQRAQQASSLTSAQAQVASAQQTVVNAQQTASIDAAQLQQAVDGAQRTLGSDTSANAPTKTLDADRSALTQAQNAQTSGLNRDQQAIATAEMQLTQANNQLSATEATNAANAELLPSDLAAAQAQVAQAQAQLLSATQTMNWTSLRAPADGIVTAVNGVIGQTVSGGGVSASASSTTATASASGSSGSGGSSSSGSGSSSPFLTITNVDALSVKAGFAETDATKLRVRQPATVSFSALPNTQASAVVTSVDVDSTLVSNVVTYFAVVALTNAPAGVKPGMTASVTVTVDRHEGVLDLPSAAVRGSGTTGTVTLLDAKVQSTKTVGIGLRGDTTTEITSGLNAGDVVVLPSSTVSGVSSQLANNANRFFTGGLGGGARLGGGGGGGARGGG